MTESSSQKKPLNSSSKVKLVITSSMHLVASLLV